MTGTPNFISTTNACKLCRPLGAAVAFKGVEGCVPFLHGSQGCATYMRRYIISHFREPVDIASSSLGEKHAVYGGGPNLKQGILNVMQKYGATAVGVATTCLTETIGDDVSMILHEFKKEFSDRDLPEMIHVNTPSYGGTHMEGFHAAVKALVEQMAVDTIKTNSINLFSGFVSPADIRYLKEVMADFSLPGVILPDYSETLDGPVLEDYQKIPKGGTPVSKIKTMGGAKASVEFTSTRRKEATPGSYLKSRFGVNNYLMDLPLGLRASDGFFETLSEISGKSIPEKHRLERGRLLDAFVDGHKYISGRRAIVYGEEDLVVGVCGFLAEIGVQPVLAASGGESGRLAANVARVTDGLVHTCPEVREGVDFFSIAHLAREMEPDMIVGSSKGYRALSKEMNIPLVRVGFPVHDRFGAQRILHLGYRGAQALFDRLVNTVLEEKQATSHVGYGYL